MSLMGFGGMDFDSDKAYRYGQVGHRCGQVGGSVPTLWFWGPSKWFWDSLRVVCRTSIEVGCTPR